MIIGGMYSFNNGSEVVSQRYPHLLAEIKEIIASVDAELHRTKESKEKTMVGKMLYRPSTLNKAFAEEFRKRGWKNQRVPSEYSDQHYLPAYQRRVTKRGAFRDMDFLKEKLGVEVQFGKYSFMVYNVAAKMTIFRNYEFIDAGVEIVPMAQLVKDMSSGVSYFEQFVWDLEHRGTADIDTPVLILGIDTRNEGETVPIQAVLDEITLPDED
jgi:hypothetical protein